MSDSRLTEVEAVVDSLESQPSDLYYRVNQLKKQRRRAIRRALSLELATRNLLDKIKTGTTEEIGSALDSVQYILNVPLHNAIRETDL